MTPLISSVTVSFLNLTSQSIFAFVDASLTESLVHLPAATPVTFGQAFPRFSKLALTLTVRAEKDILATPTAKTDDSWTVRLGRTISRKRQWEEVHIPGAPWHIYRFEMNKGHHRILLVPARDLTSWMKLLPSTVPLSALCIPGSHETMAKYGWPFSQCQDLSLLEQLRAGIRLIDIRIVVVEDKLLAYHGSTPQRITFSAILADVVTFLDSPDGRFETVIVSILEEGQYLGSSPLFSPLVRDALFSAPSRESLWYLENRIPCLGEVRGKAVLFSRFGGHGEGWPDNKMGIHPQLWPDSAKDGFEWEMPDTRVRVHDWYAISSFLAIPEKATLSSSYLLPCPAPNGEKDLAITFTSASSIPAALPSTVACGFGWPALRLGVEGVNSRVGRWLLGQLGGEAPLQDLLGQEDWDVVDLEAGQASANSTAVEEIRLRGWVFMDFCDEPEDLGLVPMLVEANWRGRKSGEEGWD